MNRIRLAVFLISVITLMTELLLTRILDYLIDPHMAYLVITCAMFSFGLSGIYSLLIRLPSDGDQRYFAAFFLLLAISILALLPAVNFLPFDARQITGSPRFQTLAFGLLYVSISIPFFLSGLFINRIFSTYSTYIQSLYFWDLIGAALGCVAFLPFLPSVGPGGLLFCTSGVALLTSALFCRRWFASAIFVAIGAIVLMIPFQYSSVYLDIRQTDRETEVESPLKFAGKLEFARWDPVAHIKVVDAENDVVKKLNPPNHNIKLILYDGGKQASAIFPFDGNFAELRHHIRTVVNAHFGSVDILASNYLKRDTGHNVLVIGVAGGREIKAALMYGAGHVDAVDLVGTVIELGQKTYAAFNGNIFNNPKVHSYVAEGRSFLRSTRTKYDIIQIITNHSTSSIAAGQAAMNPVYLQTSEAYREYFDHLTDNGILHVTQLIYPRMVTTAAKAWNEMGRTDFQKHVVVIANGERDLLKTYLVKMRPWTPEEVSEVTSLLYGTSTEQSKNYIIVENPLRPEHSFLSNEFYSGRLSPDLASRIDYRVTPATDDRPYFGFIRKHLGPVEASANTFMDYGTAWVLNQPGSAFLARDIFHLSITGVTSLFFGTLFIVAPLSLSRVGRLKWQYKQSSLFYFSCLGFGFIAIELTLIQLLIHVIGHPLYTYSTVLFVLLCAAGVGSSYSKRFRIDPTTRWTWPFIGILVSGFVFLTTYSSLFSSLLSLPIEARILASALMISPLGFFLGMPFPLGILWLERRAQDAIAWAWALNALFTVVGGFASVMISLFFGFRAALVIGFGTYLLALWTFSWLRVTEPEVVRQLILVARDRADLYQHFTRGFAGNKTVRTLLDRRVKTRRAGPGPYEIERRQADRRLFSQVDASLRAIGWTIIPLDVAKNR